MKKRILRYFKHILITLVVLLLVLIGIGMHLGAAASYGENPLSKNWHDDGPYIFYKSDSLLEVSYIQGDRREGFFLKQTSLPTDSAATLSCYYPLDSSSFEIPLDFNFEIPPTIYEGDHKILAISDLESNYRTFRDFLIHSKVIDPQLNWIFGNGHLVLVGDFVDRGDFTTQLLWFIYKLEREAEKNGGQVHFIIGNHELKCLQGNYRSASTKYHIIASILGTQQSDLFAANSFLGKWMASKNAIERINGNLFVHGGLHPDLATADINLEAINRIIRDNYFRPYYPKPKDDVSQLLNSRLTGPCWYRGFFKEDLSQEQIDQVLQTFQAKTVVVGHTIQSKVKRKFNGKVIGIDVMHPKDHEKYWPKKRSEALLIQDGKYYRVFDDGSNKAI